MYYHFGIPINSFSLWLWLNFRTLEILASIELLSEFGYCLNYLKILWFEIFTRTINEFWQNNISLCYSYCCQWSSTFRTTTPFEKIRYSFVNSWIQAIFAVSVLKEVWRVSLEGTKAVVLSNIRYHC